MLPVKATGKNVRMNESGKRRVNKPSYSHTAFPNEPPQYSSDLSERVRHS